MTANYRILVGIPAYNEEKAVAPLLYKLNRVREERLPNLTVLFVDDGSRDRTLELLRAARNHYPFLEVIAHGQNRGLGAAVRTILDHAISGQAHDDILVTLDGDNTHDPGVIPALVEKLVAEELDLVIASRFVNGGQEVGLELYRKFFSRGASLFFRLFFPIRGVRDYSCGFRAYRIAFLRRAREHWGELVTVTGFECMAEILAKFSRLRPRAGEYPIILRYDLKAGASKMKIMKTIRGYFSLLRKAR